MYLSRIFQLAFNLNIIYVIVLSLANLRKQVTLSVIFFVAGEELANNVGIFAQGQQGATSANSRHQGAINRQQQQKQEEQREEQFLIDDPISKQLVSESQKSLVTNQTNCTTSSKQSSSSIKGSSELCKTNSNAKTIEVAVFVDPALDNKFTGLSGGLVDLNKLIMTIMNQVQSLFKYSSLKIPMNIKLVLVEHMSVMKGGYQDLALPNPENGDIDAYLSNFCNWQQARLEREKRIWWDHAILLSGLDLYKSTSGKNHTGVLGLAWVGGMCKGNYSCTINEASNLESAFVIAHEIGHSLGIMHDGQRNNCDPNAFIMSERTGAGKIHWSRCSNNYLNDSINKQQLACLESEKSPSSDSLYDLSKLKAPGQVYTINDQCRLAFGNNYTSFVSNQKPFNTVCRELWCVSGTWAKAAHPALEGSLCGDQNRVCREGKCVAE